MFLATQCFGDKVVGGGRCFCYSEAGDRIYGWAWRKDAENMTCACSRQMHQSNGELTLHCDDMGNYEPLQCTGGACWCADNQSGELLQGTKLVPESMFDILPCCKYTVISRGISISLVSNKLLSGWADLLTLLRDIQRFNYS